jgi:hypothetical protein
MYVDMSNGTGWPFGGPEVSVEDAASRAIFREYELAGGQTLRTSIAVDDEKQRSVARLDKLMAYSASGEKWDLTDRVSPAGQLEWTAPPGNDCRLIALFVGKTLQQVKRAAPGGQGYVVDHLNKEAVKRYLDKSTKLLLTPKLLSRTAFSMIRMKFTAPTGRRNCWTSLNNDAVTVCRIISPNCWPTAPRTFPPA